MKEQDFYNWYKKKIEELPDEPPDRVWKEIEKELDIEDTWKRISRRLDNLNLKRGLQIAAPLSAAAIGLFLVFQFFVKDPVNQGTKKSTPALVSATNDSVIESKKEIHNQREISKHKVSPDPHPVAGNDQDTGDMTTPQNEALQTTKKIREIEQSSSDQLAYSTGIPSGEDKATNNSGLRESQTLHAPVYNSSHPALARLKSLEPNNEDETKEGTFCQVLVNNQDKNKIYFGSTAGIGNSLLLNQKTYKGFNPSGLVSAKPETATSLGIKAGMIYNPRWRFEGEIQIIANTGQTYYEFVDGNYLQNEIKLNYSHVLLQGKYHVKGFFIQNHYHANYLSLGIYGGYLHNASRNMSAYPSIISDYESYDYGLTVGYEIFTSIHPKFEIGTGIRMKYGLNNIYAGNELIPASFYQTHNASLNFTLSVQYNL